MTPGSERPQLFTCHDDRAGLPAPVDDRTAPRPGTSLRILLVEDDPADAELTRALLADAGVHAEWVHASRLAEVDFALAAHWADCALVDLSLPDAHDMEVVSAFLGHAPALPIVVLSGDTDADLALSAVREGAEDYLVKGRIDADRMTRTIRHAIERKRLQREVQATQSRQIETLRRLAGGVAHHFNNLHAVILNYAELASLETSTDAAEVDAPMWRQAHEDIEQIHRAAERAARLARQLLTFAEEDIVQPELIDLNTMVSGVRESLQEMAGDGVQLDLALSADLHPVLADRRHVEQALGNVVANAADAMPGGGRLTIATRNVGGCDRHGLPTGDCVGVVVQDSGRGIPEGDLERIFDPFFTTKPVGEGVGLGLATVRSIMSRWDGSVEVASEPGAGTTVTLLFPAVAADGDGGPAVQQDTPATGENRLVVVVDDVPAMRDLVARALRARGYSVAAAADGASALRTIEQDERPVDLLLTDVLMPELAGTELAARVHEIDPGVPVVYLSACTREELLQDGTLEPGATVLEKPFTLGQLATVVNDTVRDERDPYLQFRPTKVT